MTDISYLHRFCASKWGWCWSLTLQAPNTSNTIQYASNIPDMAEIQSICTVFGHKLHGRGPAEKSAPACLVHGKTRPSLKHEAGMRMVQDESGWKRFDKRCDNAWQTVCGCLWMSADVCGCLWMSVDVCGVCVWFVGLAGELRKKARSRSTQHGLAAELLQFPTETVTTSAVSTTSHLDLFGPKDACWKHWRTPERVPTKNGGLYRRKRGWGKLAKQCKTHQVGNTAQNSTKYRDVRSWEDACMLCCPPLDVR